MAKRFFQAFLFFTLAVLTACGGGSSDSTPAPPTTGATLSSISVEPANATVPAGTTQQYTAMGLFSDGTKKDISANVTWASANTGTATIGSNGRAAGVLLGATTISASSNGITGSTPLTISNPLLVSIGVTPASASIAKGTTQRFEATGVYSDNSTKDITSDVAWSTSNEQFGVPRSDEAKVVRFSSDPSLAGLAAGETQGSATVSAALQNIQSASVTIEVRNAELRSLAITPATQSLPKGATVGYLAIGTFSDGSTQDLTQSVTWTSSDAAVATISNSDPTRSKATAIAEGSAQIRAQSGAILSDAATLTVRSAELVSIAVTPASASLSLGLNQQFTATGTYTDGSTQDVTTTATWQSADASVASIGNGSGSSGLAISKQVGATHITAQLGNVTSTSVSLAVTPMLPSSLTIAPAGAKIGLGSTWPFKVTATYADNSTQDVTDLVTWTSSDTTVAQVSNADGTRGRVSGLALGSTSVSASLQSLTQSTPLTVDTHAWTLVAARSGQPVAGEPVLQDATGRILVVDRNDLRNSAMFDPASGRWSSIPAPPFGIVNGTPYAVTGASVTALGGGKALVAGGYVSVFDDEAGDFIVDEVLATAWVFDANAGTWTATGNLSAPRRGATSVRLSDGRVLVFGGTDSGFFGGGTDLLTSEVYDPATGVWTSVGNTTLRHGANIKSAAASGAGALVMSDAGNEIFDASSATWRAAPAPLNSLEQYALTALADGRVLKTGGFVFAQGARTAVEIYNPATDAWTGAAEMMAPRAFHQGTLLPDGRVMVVGGISFSRTAATELFDPASGSWSVVSGPMNRARANGIALLTLQDGRVFVRGGTNNDAPDFGEIWK